MEAESAQQKSDYKTPTLSNLWTTTTGQQGEGFTLQSK